jgi:hypothetical protein
MSAYGTKRTSNRRLAMSAFGGKADGAADDLEGDAMRLLGWVTAANSQQLRLAGPQFF